MGDANEATIDVEREKATLRELITENKKRTYPNPESREPFVVAWANLVRKTGIDNEAVGLLLDGMRIALAEPLHRSAAEGYVKNAYMSFFLSIQANQNSGGVTFKLIINLLALELIAPTVDGSLDFIAQRMQPLSLNKKGRVWSFLSQSLRSLLIQPLADKTICPNVTILPQSAISLQKLFGEQLERMKGHRKIDPSCLKAAVDLAAWLESKSNPQWSNMIDDNASGDEGQVVPEDTSIPSNDSIAAIDANDNQVDKAEDLESRRDDISQACVSMHEPAVSTGQQFEARQFGERNVRSSNVPSERTPEEQQAKESTGSNSDSKAVHQEQQKLTGVNRTRKLGIARVNRYLNAIREELDEYIKEHEQLKSEHSKLKSVHEATLKELSKIKKDLDIARKDVEDLHTQRLALSGNYSDIQRQADRLEAENAQLKDDIAAAEDMLTMREEHNAHQSDVANDKMVRDLRFEYEQFSEAMADDMTAELGEVMRDLLGNVFGILKSNGIDL